MRNDQTLKSPTVAHQMLRDLDKIQGRRQDRRNGQPQILLGMQPCWEPRILRLPSRPWGHEIDDVNFEPRVSVVLSWSVHDGYEIGALGEGVELDGVVAADDDADRHRRKST
jgi:hypothetical protein